MKFFTKDAHLEEVTSPVSSGGTVANEVGAIFSAMLTGRRGLLSQKALKSIVGEFCHQFSGCEQQDSREFQACIEGGSRMTPLPKKKNSEVHIFCDYPFH